MRAAIIAVGSELTSGAKLDTNSQWLSLQLAAIGVSVRSHVTVADDQLEIVAAVRDAVNRAEVVLITGGLGPTLDDLTRQALADVVNRPLRLHQPSLDFIRSLFARRNFEMPERNVSQAMFPEGSEPIPNPRGTAPGIWMEISGEASGPRSQVAALPGVPAEMRPMFEEYVLPRISRGDGVIRHLRINCFGVGESKAEEILGDLTARGRQPEVGITVHEATITLRISAHGRSVDDCDREISQIRSVIQNRLGHLVFGEEDDELQHVLVRLLNGRSLSLATAESGTGGLLAQRLSGVAGSSRCYLGGIIAPTDSARYELLGVDPSQTTGEKPYFRDAVAQMAAACRKRFSSDFALAVLEASDAPASGSIKGESPRAVIALAGQDLLEVREEMLFGDRSLVTSRTAKLALNLLRRHLIRSPV